jgi:ferredoxin
MDRDKNKELFDRREAILRYGALAVGGVLGSILLSGCRAPMVYRDFPENDTNRFPKNLGPPTGYLVDPQYCTRCGDCLRVCRCDAVGGYTFDENNKHKSPAPTAEVSDKHQCWIYIDNCCACGRCFRVCDVDAITPCYGPDKKPFREVPPWQAGMPWGFKKSDFASKDAKCCLNDEHGDRK